MAMSGLSSLSASSPSSPPVWPELMPPPSNIAHTSRAAATCSQAARLHTSGLPRHPSPNPPSLPPQGDLPCHPSHLDYCTPPQGDLPDFPSLSNTSDEDEDDREMRKSGLFGSMSSTVCGLCFVCLNRACARVCVCVRVCVWARTRACVLHMLCKCMSGVLTDTFTAPYPVERASSLASAPCR